MAAKVSLLALAGAMMLLLFGCGGYNMTTGYSSMDVNVSGTYQVLSKDPGVLQNFYSLQLTQTGKSIEGVDNLGQRWTGTLSNWTAYGVSPTQQTTTQTTTQQQQPQTPDYYQAEVYLTAQRTDGTTVAITGVIDSSVPVTLPGTTQQQQTTTDRHTVISGAVVEAGLASGSITLYNPLAITTQTTTTTP